MISRKHIIIGLIAFIVGFGVTFYIKKTYFPKHKVEETAIVKDTLTKPQE